MSSSRDTRIGEELANSLTHGFGFLLSLVGLGVLVTLSAGRGDVWYVTSFTIYGASLVCLYGASTLYHAFRDGRLKQIFKTVDHCCIYVLIAGTYTPFTLVSLRDGWGWTLFCVAWGCALAGLVFKLFFVHRFKVLSLVLYIAMGWAAVVALGPLLENVEKGGIVLLVAGGLAYTFGTVFFAFDRIPFFHAVWHVFVLVGSLCHYFAIVLYVLP